MKILSFVLVEHFGLACGAALLFLLGMLLALPAVRRGWASLTRLPLILFGMVRRLLGANPGMVRLASVIFGFNATAMLVYMASGVHPAIPAAVSMATGYNIAVILLLAGQREDLDPVAIRPSAARWMPARWVAGLCGLAVVLIELPCFWYAVAMGISLGQEIVAGRTSYADGVAVRLQAYAILIVPALLASAVCEAIAIRGMSTMPQGSGVGDQGSGPAPAAESRPPGTSGGAAGPEP